MLSLSRTLVSAPEAAADGTLLCASWDTTSSFWEHSTCTNRRIHQYIRLQAVEGTQHNACRDGNFDLLFLQ
jgi:hypothetical protein